MYVAQSNLTHDNTNAAYVERWTVEPIYDQRNIWRSMRKRMHLRGTIIPNSAPTQTQITTALETLKNAYGQNNFDIALYQDDGTRSHIYLTSSDSLGGTRVVVRDYPLDSPADYATGMNYRIVVEADYPVNEASPMVWNEEVEIIGDGGPSYSYFEPNVGLPQRYIEKQRTIQVIQQTGYALGLTAYPLYADPLLPNWEEHKQRQIKRIGPTAAGANLRYIHWGVRWSYTFYCPTPQIIYPNMR